MQSKYLVLIQTATKDTLRAVFNFSSLRQKGCGNMDTKMIYSMNADNKESLVANYESGITRWRDLLEYDKLVSNGTNSTTGYLYVKCIGGLFLTVMFISSCMPEVGDCVADPALARWELQANSIGKVEDKDRGKYLIRFCDEKENCEKKTLTSHELEVKYGKIECKSLEELKKTWPTVPK